MGGGISDGMGSEVMVLGRSAQRSKTSAAQHRKGTRGTDEAPPQAGGAPRMAARSRKSRWVSGVLEEARPGDVGGVRGGKPGGCWGFLRREAPGMLGVLVAGDVETR